MNIRNTIETFHELDHQKISEGFPYDLHPVIKLLIAIIYLILMMSISLYDLSTLLMMAVFLYFISMICNLSIIKGIKRMGPIILIFLLLGIVNVFTDHRVLISSGTITITMGHLTMITLVLKSILALIMSYFLIETTGMQGICQGLYTLHIPTSLITVIMLMYRYIIIFLKEVERISISYKMRTGSNKGLHYRTWGSVVGTMLLRSMDRGEAVYTSMRLRGYDPHRVFMPKKKLVKKDYIILISSIVLMSICRFIPIWQMIGELL